MAKYYTASDIRLMAREGRKTLYLGEGDKLTDLARDAARTAGVEIRQGGPDVGRQDAPSGAPYDLVIRGGICVIPEMGLIKTNVCISGDKIVAITTDEVRGRDTIDASGKYVLPGIIDPHTHLGLFAPLETELESETRSAILGGVTTIGTYFNREESYLPFLDLLESEVRALSRVDMIPHLTIRGQNHIDELPAYSSRGMNSFKMYMCGVPGVFPSQEDGLIVRAMKRLRELPPWANPIMSFHCENESICDYATEEWENKELKTLSDWNETHPNLAEGEAVQRAAYYAKELNVRSYVVHSSTKEAMELLPSVKHEKLYVETTSPYLCLDTNSDIGAYGKMLPPIREEASRLALWEALKKGYIDTIGTDNTVMTSAEKNVKGGMRGAQAGYPTLGTHLMSVLTEGIFRQEVPLEKLVPLMTMNPAKIFGVYPKKGTIMPGSDADLVVVDLEREGVVRPEALLSRSDFSLFQGKKMRAWPRATIKGGRIVAFEGKIVDDSVRGKILRH